MQPSPLFICRHPLVFTDEETEPQRGKGTCPRPASPPTPPPQLASEYSFLPSSDVGGFVFLVPLILFVALMAPQPQGPHGAVERLDEAVGDPGSGQLLCDAGQGASPLWVPVLLAQQGRAHQNPGTLPGPRRLVSFLRHAP